MSNSEQGQGPAITVKVNADVSTVTLLAADALRRHIGIANGPNSAIMYVKFGASAATDNFDFVLAAGESYESPVNSSVYAGIISAVWEAATGDATALSRSLLPFEEPVVHYWETQNADAISLNNRQLLLVPYDGYSLRAFEYTLGSGSSLYLVSNIPVSLVNLRVKKVRDAAGAYTPSAVANEWTGPSVGVWDVQLEGDNADVSGFSDPEVGPWSLFTVNVSGTYQVYAEIDH